MARDDLREEKNHFHREIFLLIFTVLYIYTRARDRCSLTDISRV